jgi:hypothetical protein
MTGQLIAAPALAKRWGLKTGTLSKWRRLKKGPRGWYALSPTHVVYPLEEVERFEAERRGASWAQSAAAEPIEGPGLHPASCPHPLARCYSFSLAGRPGVGCAECGKTIEPRMPEEAAS